jgi:hypothetical protein
MDWARILACVTGLVDQEQLARTEYLAAEIASCPFRKFHPIWDSHRESESSHDRGRCLQSCIHSEC